MKSIGRFVVVVFVLAMVMCSGVAYAGIAGVFRLPYDENQRWKYADGTACQDVGYRTPADQIFMQFNTAFAKYHLAEDWNGKCSRSTDLGAVLYAIADGFVEAIYDISGSDPKGFGKLLLIRHPLPDGTNRYVLYEHIQSIEINPRTGAQFKVGDPVYIGDTIARLGDGNGYYPNAAHLHLEMRRDKPICPPTDSGYPTCLYTDPYYTPLPIATALKYSSPSLFIDDRRNAIVQNLISNQWTSFAQNANAPSSSAYVEYNGERYSLKRAVDAGLIWREVYFQSNGQWYYYPDITKVMFDAGNTYWVHAFISGARLNILVPGNNFKADRAKIDMLHAAVYDMRPTHIRTETYYENLNWDSAWEWRQVQFDSITPYTVVMGHATSKSNPLGRFTSYCELISGNWHCNGWRPVDVNQLD